MWREFIDESTKLPMSHLDHACARTRPLYLQHRKYLDGAGDRHPYGVRVMPVRKCPVLVETSLGRPPARLSARPAAQPVDPEAAAWIAPIIDWGPSPERKGLLVTRGRAHKSYPKRLSAWVVSAPTLSCARDWRRAGGQFVWQAWQDALERPR